MPSQFTIYRSTDSGAPVLTGKTGSLISVLDAVLVTGYGGTGSMGWTKAFSGSYDAFSSDNRAAYLLPSKSIYLRVMDSAPRYTPTSAEAQIRLDEFLDNVDTASFLPTFTPTAIVRKSNTETSASRDWIVFGDSKTFYMFILNGDLPARYTGWMCGEFDSYLPGDKYNVTCVGRYGISSSSTGYDTLNTVGMDLTPMTGSSIARAYTRVSMTASRTLAGECSRTGDVHKGTSYVGSGRIVYPNAADNGLYLSPIWVGEYYSNDIIMRGTMRGFWQLCHYSYSFNDGDTFSGTGDLAGKTFMLLGPALPQGMYTLEISNTLS